MWGQGQQAHRQRRLEKLVPTPSELQRARTRNSCLERSATGCRMSARRNGYETQGKVLPWSSDEEVSSAARSGAFARAASTSAAETHDAQSAARRQQLGSRSPGTSGASGFASSPAIIASMTLSRFYSAKKRNYWRQQQLSSQRAHVRGAAARGRGRQTRVRSSLEIGEALAPVVRMLAGMSERYNHE